jgi:hypothetical protein
MNDDTDSEVGDNEDEDSNGKPWWKLMHGSLFFCICLF